VPKGSETVYIALIVFVVFVVLVVNGVQHVNWFTFCASRFLFKTDLIRERERESEREKEKVIKSKLAIAFVNRLLLCYLKNLLAASKVRVRGWYGAAWDELCVNWGRLHPAAVLGAFGGGGEALARATCIAWSGASCNCPHVGLASRVSGKSYVGCFKRGLGTS
jgi:hypothetical protein